MVGVVVPTFITGFSIKVSRTMSLTVPSHGDNLSTVSVKSTKP